MRCSGNARDYVPVTSSMLPAGPCKQLDPADVAIHPTLQEFLRTRARNISALVKQSVRDLNENFRLRERGDVEVDEHVAQVLLCHRCARRADRGAEHPGWFSGPCILTIGSRCVIDGVLEDTGDRTVVFGRHEDHALSGSNLTLQS